MWLRILSSCFLCCSMSPALAKATRIDFDFNQSNGIANAQGSGFLHSLTGTEPPDRFVDPLGIKLWRGACLLDDSLYQRLQRSGSAIQYVLSDGFQHPAKQGDCSKQRDTKRWPHQHPDLWRKHVENEGRRIIAKGWKVIWEPWNEPDFWPGGDDVRTEEDAFQQYLDAFLIAYQTIKKLDPHARFSGPSLSAYDGFGWKKSRRQLETFLAFCARHNLEVNDLSWHGFDDKMMHEYPQRLQEIRRLAAEQYPSVNVQRILISEIVSEAYFTSPGDLIATLKYLDDAGADLVGRACWDGCWWPTLDGSVGKTSKGEFLPTSVWWANVWYASITGPRYSGRSNKPGVAATAVVKEGRLSILLGFSQAAGPAEPQAVVLALRKLGEISTASPSIERLPDLQDDFLKTPVVVQRYEVKRKNGVVYIKLPSVQPRDAYLIRFNATSSDPK